MSESASILDKAGMPSSRVAGWRPPLQKRADFRYNNHEAQASDPSWPFLFSEVSMNPIPLAAAILVKVILEWWMED